MITLKNVKNVAGQVVEHVIESSQSKTLDGEGRLLMLPACIDTDALLPSNPQTAKERDAWTGEARRYLHAGFSTLFESTSCSASQLQQAQRFPIPNSLPLHIHRFFDGTVPEEFDLIGKMQSSVVGIKISLDLADKSIAPPHTSALDRLFQVAAQENMIVAMTLMQGKGSASEQRETAIKTIKQAIDLAEKYSAQLCLQHLRTKEELALVKQAKESGILIYIEVAYAHLFLDEKDTTKSETFLPSVEDQEVLWSGVREGAIDMVGSAGLLLPPELFLPLMLDRLSWEILVERTRKSPEDIFRLHPTSDLILVDLETKKPIPQEIVKQYPHMAKWENGTLSGWPANLILNGSLHNLFS